jgi:hypothetical protein
MIPIKRNHIDKLFTSLSGVICFFLFAVQLNSQYLLPADPSADAKDPVSIVARAVSSSSLFGTEHLPVHKEEVRPVVYRTSVHREFAVPDQGLVVSSIHITSPRGPPAA